MHIWGEPDVDWAGISDAAYYIGRNLRKWGRVGVTDMKEKYGTTRVYCSFGWYSLHSITHPGWAFIQYKKGSLLHKLEYSAAVSWIVRKLGQLVTPYQKWLYKYLYKQALKKWPHLAGEILLGADWTELLVGLDSRLVIEEDPIKKWTTITWVDPNKPQSEEDEEALY